MKCAACNKAITDDQIACTWATYVIHEDCWIEKFRKMQKGVNDDNILTHREDALKSLEVEPVYVDDKELA